MQKEDEEVQHGLIIFPLGYVYSFLKVFILWFSFRLESLRWRMISTKTVKNPRVYACTILFSYYLNALTTNSGPQQHLIMLLSCMTRKRAIQ